MNFSVNFARPKKLAFLAIISLTGCITDRWSLRELRLSRVELRDQSTLVDITSKDFPFPFPAAPVLSIYFTSRANLHKYTLIHEYVLNREIAFCRNHSVDLSRRLDGLIEIYDKKSAISDVDLPGSPSLPDSSSGLFTYHIYVDVESKGDSNGGLPFLAYDLRTEPQDICFYVQGGGIVGMRYKSNTVFVAKSAIQAALSRGYISGGQPAIVAP